MAKKYGEDRGGQSAMMLSYRGFFSIFPLLLAFVNVVGLLLANNPELRDDLIESTLAAVPVIGDEISSSATTVRGSWWVIVGSVLVSIWAGLGLLEVLQEALNNVWGVPRFDRRPWILRRLTALPGAVLIGACLVLSGAATWIFNDRDLPGLQRGAGYLLPFLAGSLCYLGLHALLCVRKVPFTACCPARLSSECPGWGCNFWGPGSSTATCCSPLTPTASSWWSSDCCPGPTCSECSTSTPTSCRRFSMTVPGPAA
ncbi:MAG: YihY/virulence factor BrkB family protein [Microthrixaceae bacterium]